MAKKGIMIGFAFLVAFCTWGLAYEWPVPDTGQTKCYNNGGEIPCLQPGEPFYGQDGNNTINLPSYTKLHERENRMGCFDHGVPA